MSIFEQIGKDINAAMKSRESDKLTALRAIKAELLLAKTKEGAAELTEDVELKCIRKLVKQRKDSAEIFKAQGRDDLYEKEILEVSFIEPYLPKQMSEAELEAVLKDIIASVGASSVSELGKVMGVASKQLAGKADGKLISETVKKLLS